MPTKGKHKKKKKSKLTAKNADIHKLYELAVQEPSADVDFIDETFTNERGRKPILLREDFCGTANLSAAWVGSDEERMAIGLDLDQPTLDWGMKHNLEPLGDAARRVKLLRRDVRDGCEDKADVIVAFNFSYWCFMERQQLVDYFKSVRKGLRDDGAFVVDVHGGPDAQCEVEEEEDKKGFIYVWEQEPLDAITNRCKRRIHFKFHDGSKIKDAFTYEWRVYSLPEIRDALREAGYDRVEVYWEGVDDDGEGDGVFEKADYAENEECWIAYMVAWANP